MESVDFTPDFVFAEFERYVAKTKQESKSKRAPWRFDVWSHTPIKTYQGLGSFNPDLYIFDDVIPPTVDNN
jgi:hypothetical protein